MTVSLPLDLLIEGAVLLAALAGMWSVMRAELRDIRRQVELHGPDVRKILPLESRFDQFESHIHQAVSGLREDMKGVAAGLQELAVAVARRAG